MLKRQLDFIRQFYETSSAPFIECKRLIDNEEEPFIPPYDYDYDPEYGELFFRQEFDDAEESLQILGYACVSMLSNLLKVYFQEWERLRIGKYDKKDCDSYEFHRKVFLRSFKRFIANCQNNLSYFRLTFALRSYSTANSQCLLQNIFAGV